MSKFEFIPSYCYSSEVPSQVKNLADKFKYKPLGEDLSVIMREYYKSQLPEWVSTYSGPLCNCYDTIICDSFTRCVIGDYGPYIEFLEPASGTLLTVEEGQEYRQSDAYKNNVKFDWLTVLDGSHVKIYHQKKRVSYADYVVGRYYISPFEVKPAESD